MSRRLFFVSLILCVLQGASAYEEDLKFVAGLTEEGFPKLAEKVLFRTLEKYPAAEKEAPELRIRILIADKKFEDAARQIQLLQNPPRPSLRSGDPSAGGDSKKSPSAEGCPEGGEGLWLFLAESAYQANQKSVAESAYANYFKMTEIPDDQAAFNYGSLLEECGDDAAAIKLYEKVDSRPVKSRLAALLIEDDPDRALKLAEEVQLGGLDLWFGNAVVSWAQIMIANEERDEAQSVLETQLELLKSIGDSVPPAVSPLAGARYFLGVCYEQADKKADALTQFYNVYAKYGDSEWGPRAQEKAQALIADFEAQGKTVNIDLGANLAKMEGSAFRVGRRLFFDRQYADALPATIDALNEYPEGDESITALRELALSAIQLDDELTAKTVGFYLAERFSGEPNAGEALLAAGKAALDSKKEDLAWWLYGQTLAAFPAHPKMPAVLYSLAALRNDESYLFQILENYPDSTYRARALGRLAWNAYKAEDYKLAAERFAPYVDTETDPQKQIRARFAFSDSYRQQALGSVGDTAPPILLESKGRASLSERAVFVWNKALEQYQTLEKQIEKARVGFGVSAETLSFNKPYWEKSIYYQAVCHKELGETDEAVTACDRFISTFPRSGIIEQAQFTKGKTLIEAERFAEALAALEGLGGKFAEPVCYYRGVAQYETDAFEQSFQTLEKLLTDWPASAFTYEAMFVQGRAFNAAGRPDDAIRVFGEIMNVAPGDGLMHRAGLELGRAQSDPAEKLASFQRVALLADPEKHQELIADALFESLPLYLELARPADLIADADRLTLDFPAFARATAGRPPLEEISNLKKQAKTALAKQQEETTNERE